MVETQTNSTDLKSLIPRKALFGNPDRVSPQLSPDGKRLSFLAPLSTASVSSLLRRTVLHHNAGAAVLTRIQVVRLAPHVIFTPNPGIFT